MTKWMPVTGCIVATFLLSACEREEESEEEAGPPVAAPASPVENSLNP